MNVRLKRYPAILLTVSAGFLLLIFLLIHYTGLSLGVQGEWVWERRDATFAEIFALFAYEVPFFLILAGTVWWICGKFERWNSRKILPLAALILAGSLHYNTVVWDSGPGQRGENISAFLDVYTGGYLTEAVRITDAREFFASYASRMAAVGEKAAEGKPPSHLDVHPPGNVFFSYLVLQFARHAPGMESLTGFIASPEVREELKTLAKWKVFTDLPEEPAVYDAAVLLLGLSNLAIYAGLLLSLLAAVVLARRTATVGGMLWAAFALIYLCSGPVLFTGHYDTFMFFWGALAAFLISLTLTAKSSRGRIVFAAATGIALAAATSCTLAFGALILFAGLAFLLIGRDWSERFVTAAVFGGSGLLSVGVLYLATGVNMIDCAFYALHNHSAFFRETGRSVGGWWPYHLLDMFLFAGAVTLVLMFALFRFRRKVLFRRTPKHIFLGLSAFLLLLLLTTPFGRGEMGRLMLFYMPCCLVAAALSINTMNRIGLNKGLLITVLLGNAFLTFVIRVTLKLVMFH